MNVINKNVVRIQGNDLEHSKNVNDWMIRSQAPKPAILARAWRRFRDYMEVGRRELAILDEFLRYSPPENKRSWIKSPGWT